MKAALGLAIGLGVLAWCGRAGACSCAEPTWIVPDGASDVPTNTKIWIPERRAERLLAHHLRSSGTAPKKPPWPNVNTANLREAIVLRGPAGEVTELHIESLELDELRMYFVVTPHHELAPGAYVLGARIAQDAQAREDWGKLGAAFSVGITRQETPLPPPSAAVMHWDHEDVGYCGMAIGASLTVSPPHWLVAYEAVDPAKPNDPKRKSTGYLLGSREVWFGDGPCTSRWDFSKSSALVRFGSLDYAGKFSGFGPPLRLDAPWTPAELTAETMARFKLLHEKAMDRDKPPPRSGSCACGVQQRSGHDFGGAARLVLILGLLRRRSTTRAAA